MKCARVYKQLRVHPAVYSFDCFNQFLAGGCHLIGRSMMFREQLIIDWLIVINC
jgi:hypothetical protein